MAAETGRARRRGRRMNWGGLVIGGILAGVLVFAQSYLLGRVGMEMAELAGSPGLPSGGAEAPEPVLPALGIALAIGIALAWLYAAIRPRYGPGPLTALRAAFYVWVLLHALRLAILAMLKVPVAATDLAISILVLFGFALAAWLAGVCYWEADETSVEIPGA